MFGRQKKLGYEILVPALEKPINKLSKKEAQAYFDWYISKINDRIAYLGQHSGVDLNYSHNSLVSLWSWFLRNAEVENTPESRLQEIEQQLIAAKSPFVKEVLADSAKQLTLVTECMVRDIGMYWGEVFIKSDPRLYWTFYTRPKSDVFVNQPLLLGFPNEIFPEKEGAPFCPTHMVRIQALRLLDNEAWKGDLLRVHKIWEEKLLHQP